MRLFLLRRIFMIGISKLYLGQAEPSDALRYGRESKKLPSHLLQFSADKKPVVVWNCTQACNLRCRHCYASCADGVVDQYQMTTQESCIMIDDLATFGVPVLLFSGGEPLLRSDLYELASYAVSKGMRAVISTNGTLITADIAKKLKEIGLSYVGISLDGLEEQHNYFRRSETAFSRSIQAIKHCLNAGIKVGIRLTLQKLNFKQLPEIFQLIKEHQIPRACFYHYVTCGDGKGEHELALNHEETKWAVDTIISQTKQLHDQGCNLEILTVDNHCDGIYLYERMKRENHSRADDVLELLRMNGGNNSGVGIASISWNGDVFPDQFWRTRCVGNVLKNPFSTIWTDPKNPLLSKLRHKKELVQGKCKTCQYLDICGGNLRIRADRGGDDFWDTDPACYLS